ncbi:hypothetical protein [Sphingorhabdus sp. 109]|uniref:hypothetical protein n=1 Tax=Sphingorhabdus sp. 109 TaxID=2653173 RepID=UPI0013573431|nr:hypothetical protein [Sphingorhabdus sp. 109]
MGKRRPSLSADQLGFSFDAPKPAREAAALSGMDRIVASGISQALTGDGRSRWEISGKVSELLSEDVSKLMLDAYASEARGDHNVPMHRALAIIAVTERVDILDAWLRRIGVSALDGDEIKTAKLGHLQRRLAEIKLEIKEIEKTAMPIKRERK